VIRASLPDTKFPTLRLTTPSHPCVSHCESNAPRFLRASYPVPIMCRWAKSEWSRTHFPMSFGTQDSGDIVMWHFPSLSSFETLAASPQVAIPSGLSPIDGLVAGVPALHALVPLCLPCVYWKILTKYSSQSCSTVTSKFTTVFLRKAQAGSWPFINTKLWEVVDALEGMHKHCNRPLVGGFLG
jgi:hypothetical protein